MGFSIKNLVSQWVKSEDAVNRQQFRGKTAPIRFRGLRQSERNQAKFMLLAMLPILAVSPFMSKWSDASMVQKAVMLVTGIWGVAVMVSGTFLAFRSIYRAVKKSGD